MALTLARADAGAEVGAAPLELHPSKSLDKRKGPKKLLLSVFSPSSHQTEAASVFDCGFGTRSELITTVGTTRGLEEAHTFAWEEKFKVFL